LTDSLSEASRELKEIQNNIQDAVKAVEPIFSKLSTLIDERNQLKHQVQEVQRKFESLSSQISDLQKKLNDDKIEFEAKLQTSDNKIVSLQREVDLTTMENQKLSEQLKSRDEKIVTLEAQKEELMQSLRDRTG
jgi:chromosome segregation ATPase